MERDVAREEHDAATDSSVPRGTGGAVAGAASGAVAGTMFGGVPGAVVGAVIGAAAGGAFGHALEGFIDSAEQTVHAEQLLAAEQQKERPES